MRKLFFILTTFFLTFLFSSILHAEEPNWEDIKATSCDRIDYVPEVIFKTSYGELKYDYTNTRSSLTKLGRKYGTIEEGLFASGLATVEINWEITLDTMTRVLEGKEICVIPVKVNVFLGYENPTIYISKELKPDTCEYEMVLRHERAHQQINLLALEHFISKIKLAVDDIVAAVKPVEIERTSQIDFAVEELTKEYVSDISPIVEFFKKKVLQEHKKLDNRDNYNYEKTICK